MLSFVEIGPGFAVNGANDGLGLVEIEPGYDVNGCVGMGCSRINGAYPDYGQMYGASLGAYDNVQLVGPGGVELVGADDDRPWYKKPLVMVGLLGGLAAVGTGGYFLLR